MTEPLNTRATDAQIEVDFYFDFISPYAYLAWQSIGVVCAQHGATLRPRPVLFAALLAHWGQLGPAEIPPKRTHTYRHVVRLARRLGVPVTLPPSHPFVPLAALRTAIAAPASIQVDVISALYDAIWGRGESIEDVAGVRAALQTAGLPVELAHAATDLDAKQQLRDATGEAVQQGVFGVPTMIVAGELFFGNDTIVDLGDHLSGTGPDLRAADRLASLPGIQRPR